MRPLRFSFAAFCNPAAPLRKRLPNPAPVKAEVRAEVFAEAAADLPHEEPAGCGWFDSSWTLRRGLQITELAPADAALPLGWWLAWQPAPQRVPALALTADSAAR